MLFIANGLIYMNTISLVSVLVLCRQVTSLVGALLFDHHCCLEALALVSRLSQEHLMWHLCTKIYNCAAHDT